jgi:hypothetical protein
LADQTDKLLPQAARQLYAVSKGESAVPNSLDVAKQRKLIEDLKRGGEQTKDAEIRLRDMLETMTLVRCYRSDTAPRARAKRPEGAEHSSA